MCSESFSFIWQPKVRTKTFRPARQALMAAQSDLLEERGRVPDEILALRLMELQLIDLLLALRRPEVDAEEVLALDRAVTGW